jgi:glycine/D-amino acid oxidase-like deaminating enzyme
MPGLAVKKRKGHLTITDPYSGFIHHQLVELGYLKSAHSTPGDSVAFNVQPRKNGQVVVGSSRQYDVEGGEVDDAILLRMINRAAEYLPKLSKMSKVRVWTGFRPATPDNLPLIGPWPGDSTLFVAAGHEGLGITTSLATGRILADQIAGKKSAIPIEPYLPSRMSVERVHV